MNIKTLIEHSATKHYTMPECLNGWPTLEILWHYHTYVQLPTQYIICIGSAII